MMIFRIYQLYVYRFYVSFLAETKLCGGYQKYYEEEFSQITEFVGQRDQDSKGLCFSINFGIFFDRLKKKKTRL